MGTWFFVCPTCEQHVVKVTVESFDSTEAYVETGPGCAKAPVWMVGYHTRVSELAHWRQVPSSWTPEGA